MILGDKNKTVLVSLKAKDASRLMGSAFHMLAIDPMGNAFHHTALGLSDSLSF